MDPKVQKELADAIEELEAKLEPLRSLESLSANLGAIEGDLSAAVKALRLAGEPFPNALTALTRASDRLADAATILKDADASGIARNLGQIESSLRSMSSGVVKAVEEQGAGAKRGIETVAEKIDTVGNGIEAMDDRLEGFNNGLKKEISTGAEVIIKHTSDLSEALWREVRKIRRLALGFGVVGVMIGTAIIGIVLLNDPGVLRSLSRLL